ncbi:MAG: ABC transporter permease [Desulfomonilaceae bacterium]|nr:ABC transporter permease [Desulfomonilaceae bacterium]
MLASDFAYVCMRQIVRHGSRYRGVIAILALGIAGLIVLATLGRSVELAVGRNLEILGRACLIQVEWSTDGKAQLEKYGFDRKDLERLRQLPLALHVTPFVSKSSQRFFSEDKVIYGRILGVEPYFFDSLDVRLASGRRITEADVAEKKSVGVIGSTVLGELFPGNGNETDRTLWMEGLSVEVIGVVGGIEDRSMARSVILPISVALTRLADVNGFNGFFVRARHWNDVEKLKTHVSYVLLSDHLGYRDYIKVQHFPHIVKTIKKSVFLVKSLLVIALIVILLLGGLGIMNMMFNAVQERTRDIGLCKAVGATEHWITMQFLVEAIVISLTGALLGVVAGIVTVETLKRALHTVPDYGVLLLSIAGGLIFGIALGAAAGLFPARKAGDLDPAQAMRFE